ncbi:Uncharacterized protein Adt_03089 [Abeliophyllum distichum]|uniref:Uncharacterized protein n=1 Tax=Abeliophyllum distichum TaxID=126358 RepID=A0ABD1VXN6_9LAMI
MKRHLSVSPSMANMMPIQRVDTSTSKELAIISTLMLIGGGETCSDPSIRWAAMEVLSIMVEADFVYPRESYRITVNIELILPGPHERAYFLRMDCIALHMHAFVARKRLPLHPLFLKNSEGL